MDILIWIGILICLSQSAMFSGLRLDPDPSDHVMDKDIILVWGEERRVITGADILGRLLRGVIQRERRD